MPIGTEIMRGRFPRDWHYSCARWSGHKQVPSTIALEENQLCLSIMSYDPPSIVSAIARLHTAQTVAVHKLFVQLYPDTEDGRVLFTRVDTF